MLKVDETVVYSLITRPLIVAIKEIAEWGYTREYVMQEMAYAIHKGFKDASIDATKSDAGH